MELVIIESPYAGEVERNLLYLRAAVRDCLRRGEAPFASHGFYTQYLEDWIPEDRKLGIECGFAWWKSADKIAFYIDLGFSGGMSAALDRANALKKPMTMRSLDAWK